MHKSFASLAFLAALLGGCMSMPPSLNPSGADPSNPSAPEASARRLRPHLVATTKVYLDPSAGQGAEKMDMSKMQGNGGMQGMDHSKMPGMEAKPPAGAPPAQPGGMQGMDHSKMQGMENKQSADQPGGKQGMDHSKMPGMEAKQPPVGAPSPPPEGMKGMDHSKMPGMGAQQPSAPSPGKEALEMEMKKTSDEMKKLSDELKAKSDAARPAEKPGDKPEASAKPPAVFYTCPMHPQIHQAKPGQCPICGMTLVKKNGP